MNPAAFLDNIIADPYTVARQGLRVPSMASREPEPSPYELYLQKVQMQQAQQQAQQQGLPVPQQPAEPVEEESGGGFLGTLGYIGDSLDKFGSRQLRGLTKGRFRELLSFIPFSDALGITDPKDIVSGGDILGTKRKRGLKYRVAELGVEMLLDPISLLGPGIFGKALKASGKAAKAAKILDDLPDVAKAKGMGPEVAKGTLTPQQLISYSGPVSSGLTNAERFDRFKQAVAQAEGVPVNSLSRDVVKKYLNEPLGGVLSINPARMLRPLIGGEQVFGTQAELAAKGGLPILNKLVNKPLKYVTESRVFPFLETVPITRALDATGASQFAIPRIAGQVADAAIGTGSLITRKTLDFAESILANPAVAMDHLRGFPAARQPVTLAGKGANAASQPAPAAPPPAAAPPVVPVAPPPAAAPPVVPVAPPPAATPPVVPVAPPPLARFIGASRAAATTSTPAVPPILEQASYPPPATKIADDKRRAFYGPKAFSDAERDLYSFKNPPPYTPEAMDALAREMMKGGVVPSMKSLADAKKATRFVKPVGTDQATRKTFKPRDPSRPLSVRFNLQEGQYKGMWVVEDESTGQRFYYDPEKTSLRMESPLLHNEPSGASKIFDAQKKIDENTAAGVESSKDLLKAARKQAVARVLASKVEALPIESIGDEVSSLLNVGYNPKKAPYWRNIQTDQNIDLTPGKTAITKGRQVFGDFAAPAAPQAPAKPVAKPSSPPVAPDSAAASADSVVQAANLNSEQREALARNIKRYGLNPEEHGMTQAEVDSLVKAMDERYASRFAKINESPASFSGGTVVRYTLEDGTGLLNRNAWDLSKLTEKEELELPNLLEFGLEQPKDVAADSTFVFTLDGEKKHKRLLSLMKKAARGKVVRTEIEATAKPVWESRDGQLAFSGKPVKEGKKFKFASAAEPVAKPEQPAKVAKSTAKKAQPKVPQKQTVKSLQQYFDFISNTPTGKSAKSKATTASSASASGATFSQSVDAALASSPAMAKKIASGQTLGEIVSMAVRNMYNSKAVHKATPRELRDMYQQFMDAIDNVASKSGVSSADIAEAQGLFNRIVGDHKLTQ